ncbi:hypothetical protein SADUNF_Sadunf01G0093600 [Salix dunnii]|uniref:Prokaryotic-type class I peptide chain release factors domain-containing protein n=1 Tax=Salix dunnii TaxID=1413687 RepID=A0A835NAB3_9ROSI|nr:hypothetical protein SADUNF_Sadunf01G0093600 [Salix dunnii]
MLRQAEEVGLFLLQNNHSTLEETHQIDKWIRKQSYMLPSQCFTHFSLPPYNKMVGEVHLGRLLPVTSSFHEFYLKKKVSARLSQVQQLLREAEERASAVGNEPTPKITRGHVTVSFARSGGPGGQNVNKVNTKVDMRFNVKNAYWLSDRIRERIMQMEKNRINKDGEIVISSTKTRTQTGNVDDALAKLQAIIDAASYVPPPPSEEQKKKIVKLAAIGEQKRLTSKKALSDKKASRRGRDNWD